MEHERKSNIPRSMYRMSVQYWIVHILQTKGEKKENTSQFNHHFTVLLLAPIHAHHSWNDGEKVIMYMQSEKSASGKENRMIPIKCNKLTVRRKRIHTYIKSVKAGKVVEVETKGNKQKEDRKTKTALTSSWEKNCQTHGMRRGSRERWANCVYNTLEEREMSSSKRI